MSKTVTMSSIEEQERPHNVPSFSIVLETENLSNTDFEDIFRCLDSLDSQDISPTNANEVLLVESGDAPPDLIEKLRVSYPWITIHQVGPETGYYESKMYGSRYVTGEIVVFCDSDGTYQPGWLKNLLLPFIGNSDIQIIAGETSMAVTGSYSLAMVLIWAFPPFSHREELYESHDYLANNVAFRRDFLIRYPIPSGIPIYRGNGMIHAAELRRKGYKIWKQPKALNIHPLPPKGLLRYFWHFLISGHDWFIWKQLSSSSPAGCKKSTVLLHNMVALTYGALGMFARPFRRLPAALRDEPRRLFFLPLTMLIILTSILLFMSGVVVTVLFPHFLLASAVKKLNESR
jgi:glycosyltransferase involved in cell wall biosynthesis